MVDAKILSIFQQLMCVVSIQEGKKWKKQKYKIKVTKS